MRAADTLSMKLAFDAQLSDPLMGQFFDNWIRRDPMAQRSMPSNRIAGVDIPWTGERICEDFHFALSMTENWYVGKETMQVVSELAKIMPPEVIQREDLPSSAGWLIFETPWFLTDVHQNRMPIRGIMWSSRSVGKGELNQRSQPGIVIWCLIDVNDNAVEEFWRHGATDKQVVKDLVRRGMRLTPASNFSVAFDAFAFELADTRGIYLLNEDQNVDLEKDDEPGVWRVRSRGQAEAQLQLEFDKAEDAASVRRSQARRMMQEWQRVRPEPIVQFLQALWRFQDTKLAAVEREHLRKSTAKLMLRRQMVPNPVAIITLRKREASGEPTGIHWQLSHQFWVRAHWRRQWYPSEGRHKSIPIAPFKKGPDDAPWMVRDRVNAIVR